MGVSGRAVLGRAVKGELRDVVTGSVLGVGHQAGEAMVPVLIGVATFAVRGLALTPEQKAQHLMGSAQGFQLNAPAQYSGVSDLVTDDVRATRVTSFVGRTVYVGGVEKSVSITTADWSSAIARSCRVTLGIVHRASVVSASRCASSTKSPRKTSEYRLKR